MSATTFQLEQLAGELAAAIPALAVGPWRCAPAGLVAFDAGEAAAPRWRVELGGDPAANQRALAGGEHSVARTHARLDDAPHRLDRAIDHALAELARASGPPRAPARASHTAPRPPVVTADARLLAALTGAAPPGLDELAWSTDPTPAASAGPEPGRLAQLLERIADLARGRSRIETRVEGALVAHSVTTLSGDTELWIAPRLSLTGARLHARSVAVAVRTRHAWARILTLVVRGASRLAALGLPAGAVSALPVVWRFVRDVLRELRHRDAALGDPL